MEGYSFHGVLSVDLRLRLLGTSLTRCLGVTYGYTPERPFFDSTTQQYISCTKALALKLEILARRLWRSNGPPAGHETVCAYQPLAPSLLSGRVFDFLEQRIDIDARRQDL